uniref:Uncharacterized protein n=1 Tax=Nelumbo nucifera TaxID=4432 RepID=A0A822ZRR1_NELNU|nr:TPA_asm: hypothetical protein HUJ06_004345 [Nelumbo nucifera]
MEFNVPEHVHEVQGQNKKSKRQGEELEIGQVDDSNQAFDLDQVSSRNGLNGHMGGCPIELVGPTMMEPIKGGLDVGLNVCNLLNIKEAHEILSDPVDFSGGGCWTFLLVHRLPLRLDTDGWDGRIWGTLQSGQSRLRGLRFKGMKGFQRRFCTRYRFLSVITEENDTVRLKGKEKEGAGKILSNKVSNENRLGKKQKKDLINGMEGRVELERFGAIKGKRPCNG